MAARWKSASARRHRMSTSRRIVPRPVHGASTRTRSKTSPNGAPRSRVERHDSRAVETALSQAVAQQPHAPPTAVRRDELPGRRGTGAENQRLAAGRRAGVERARARRRARHQRHELARLVLYDELPAVCERRPERVPRFDGQSVRREAERCRDDAFAREPVGQRIPGDANRVGPNACLTPVSPRRFRSAVDILWCGSLTGVSQAIGKSQVNVYSGCCGRARAPR